MVFDERHGRFLVVWQDDRNQVWPNNSPTPAIFGQFVTRGGLREGVNFTIAGGNSRGGRDPAVAYDAIGDQHLVIWSDRRMFKVRGDDIYAQFIAHK